MKVSNKAWAAQETSHHESIARMNYTDFLERKSQDVTETA